MIVTGAFIGPVEGESPRTTEKRFSSAKADTEMSATIMMQLSFFMCRTPAMFSWSWIQTKATSLVAAVTTK